MNLSDRTVAGGPAVRLEPLSAAAFRPFGDVVAATGPALPINGGTAMRYSDLAAIEVAAGGRPATALIRTVIPARLPLAVTTVERHPLGSQAFIPLNGALFVVVVSRDEGEGLAAGLRAFVTDGRQGINYRPNVWHHALIALTAGAEFLVIDRVGEGNNLELASFPPVTVLDATPV